VAFRDDLMAATPFAAADHAALRLSRGLPGDGLSIEGLLAVAQRVLGLIDNDADRDGFQVGSQYDVANLGPIIAAARTLDALSSRSDPSLEDPAAIALTAYAATAYAMYGNFPSANVIAQRIAPFVKSLSDYAIVALAASSPRLHGDLLNRDAGRETSTRHFIEALAAFHQGQPVATEDVIDRYTAFARRAELTEDVLLITSARLALRHQLELSSFAVLKSSSALSQDMLASVTQRLPETFLPPQYRAIKRGLLVSKGNALLTFPTSTGKTNLGLLSMAASLDRDDGIAVFVAPYIAIARQTLDHARELFAGVAPCFGLFSGTSSRLEMLLQASKAVLVATPESFDQLLNVTRFLPRLRCVVVDEAHLIANGERGARLEGITTRLRLAQESGSALRLVLMSAVVEGEGDLRRWLGISPAEHYDDQWRPTARRVAVWSQAGALRWYQASDPLRLPQEEPSSPVGEKLLSVPRVLQPTTNYGVELKNTVLMYENTSLLCRQLYDEIGGPLLCVCGFKRATRGIARLIAATRDPDVVVPEASQDLISAVLKSPGHYRDLVHLIERRVAYHNASLPTHIRALIEAAVKVRSIDIVVSTTTLAEGSDLPFRVTVLHDWLVGYKESQRPMSPLLFRNIAGRCGRAGQFTQGDTVIVDNPVGNMFYTGTRAARQGHILGLFTSPPLLGTPYDHAGSVEAAAVDAEVGAQYLSAVSENPNIDDLKQRYNSFALRPTERSIAAINRSIEAILATVPLSATPSDATPFGIAASPIRLTTLGMAANRTGYSPISCRRILRAMSSLPAQVDDLDYCATLMLELGTVPEQRNDRLRKMVAGGSERFCVKRADLAAVIRGWAGQQALIEMFRELPATRRANRQVSFDDWLADPSLSETWTSTYDSFIDFVEQCLGQFLPGVLSACAEFAPFAGTRTAEEWVILAKRLARDDYALAWRGLLTETPTA
jgi:helicase